MSTLWIDVTELFAHFRNVTHATGVSRVVLELADGLMRDHEGAFGKVVPIYWDPVRGTAMLFPAEMAPLRQFFDSYREFLIASGWPETAPRGRLRKALVTSLPRRLRFRLFAADNAVTQFVRTQRRAGRRPEPAEFGAGDLLFLPGSFWLDRYAPRLVRKVRAHGGSVAAFVHDMLPLAHPEWWRPPEVEQFRRACQIVLPQCDAIIANSAHTAEQLRRHVRNTGTVPVTLCRLGDIETPPIAPVLTPRIAAVASRRFMLFVASHEARKNHRALLAAWTVLEQRFGASTPLLVFVGRGTSALPQTSAHVMAFQNLSDGEREALYAAAWMTAYPSFEEGYGLSVAEALARGRIVLASNTGGMREIAPELVDLIDPYDPQSIADAVGAYLDDGARHAARAAAIRAYRPTPWSETVAMVGTALRMVN